jgi:hypothetical protein
MAVVLNETEPYRLTRFLIATHDETFHTTSNTIEQLKYLFLGSVDGKVANVERT